MMKNDWVSTCCEAVPLGETDSDKKEPLGMCSECRDQATFYLQCYYCAQDARECDCQKSAHDDDRYLAYKEGDWPHTDEPILL